MIEDWLQLSQPFRVDSFFVYILSKTIGAEQFSRLKDNESLVVKKIPVL